MNAKEKTRQELQREIEDLHARLEEAEETLRAIRSGEVDALVVSGPQGEQVYTLKGVDYTYRILVEGMNEGAVTMTAQGDILYCNDRFGKMVRTPLEQVIASSIYRFVVPADQPLFDALLRGASPKNGRGELTLRAGDGTLVPVYLSFIILQMEGLPAVCMMATDLTEQKRHEEMVASERLARSILDQTAQAIVVCDENGRIIRASQAAHQLCDQNPLLQPFDAVFALRIVPQQIRPSGEEAESGERFSLAPILRGEKLRNMEARFTRRDGQRCSLLLSAGPLLAQNQVLGCVITLTDITERKRAEEALRESEGKLKTLFETLPVGVSTLDAERKITYVNPALERILDISTEGLSRGDYRSRTYLRPDGTLMPAEEFASVRAVKEQRAVHNVEIGVVKEDGNVVWTAVSAVPVAFPDWKVVIVTSDITERVRAEEALRESEKRFRLLYENAPVGYQSLDEDGRFLEVNKAWLDLLGYSKEEVIGHWFGEFLAPGEQERLKANFARFKAAGEIYGVEYEIVRKDGSRLVVSLDGRIGYDEQGNFKQTHCIMYDITDRKRAEEERERLLAELKAKNRELESFVYSVSHDLKAPLVSLGGFSSLLQKKFHDQLGEQGNHYLERIRANVVHMNALITDLLKLSRIGQVVGPVEEIDVAALLREIQEELAVELEEAGAEFVVQESLPTACADRDRMRQVFVNLIDNAVKFRSEERALRIEVGCQQEGGFYRFHVADNGIGIAPQYHEQIFAPFRQLDPETEGVGMGLALLKKIVEHHGGRVWVESEHGKGATFYFTVPLISKQ